MEFCQFEKVGTLLVILKWTVYYLLKRIKFSVKKKH